MIVQIIGYGSLLLFILQFFLTPLLPNYKEIRGYYIIDNSLLLIAAAICFK